MARPRYDVIGIGNAIVDIVSFCDDAFLAEHGAAKGHTRLVDRPTIDALYAASGPSTEISGGSAANTIAGIAALGGRTAFIGKIADDEFGRIFHHDLTSIGVDYRTAADSSGREPTARSLVLVTPDGQRTMNTFLGVSPFLTAEDLDADRIAAADILYLEGYLFDRDEAKDAFSNAAAIAKSAGTKVSLTLSDAFCVDRHRAAFRELIARDVDILFANEAELLTLYQTEDFESAFQQCAETVSTLAGTRSENGSRIKTSTAVVDIPAEPNVRVVDTTGAGDLYAAGVLFGLSRNYDVELCGRIGSMAAAEIISHIGARPQHDLKALVLQNGISL